MIELRSAGRGALGVALLLGGTTSIACGDDSVVGTGGGGASGGTTTTVSSGGATTTSGTSSGSTTTSNSTATSTSTVTSGDPVAGPTSTSSGDGGQGQGAGGNGGAGQGGEGAGSGTGGAGAGGNGPGGGGVGGSGATSGSGGSGGAPDPFWGCLGNVTWPELEVDPINVRLRFIDNFTGSDLGGLPVRACARDDLDCASPLAENTTASDGAIAMDVPVTPDVGFEGYLEVGPGTADNGSDVPLNIIMTVRPFTNDPTNEQGIVTSPALAALMFLGGIESDPELGHFAAITFRCDDQEVDGVTIEALSGADASSTFYLANGQDPSQGLTMTDGSGVAAIANLEPGRIDIRSELAATAETISLTDVIIRPGAVTSAGLVPTP